MFISPLNGLQVAKSQGELSLHLTSYTIPAQFSILLLRPEVTVVVLANFKSQHFWIAVQRALNYTDSCRRNIHRLNHFLLLA